MTEREKLSGEASRLTQLLSGLVVREVFRHRDREIGIEFSDGTRLFVDSATPIEVTVS